MVWFSRILATIFFIVGLSCSAKNGTERDIRITNPPEVLGSIELSTDLTGIHVKKQKMGEGKSALAPLANEKLDGIDFDITDTNAFQNGSLWWTCGNLVLTNNSGTDLTGLILIAYEPGSGEQQAVRTGNSGTGFDGSGTGYRTEVNSNGGWSLWIISATSGSTIPNGESSEPRQLCLASPTGYSSSIWNLYSGVPTGRIIDRRTGEGIQGWVMLGYSNPDDERYHELGLGNFILTDVEGNFAFPVLDYPGPHTITAGASGYSNITVIDINNIDITLKLERNTKSYVSAGNYNGTMGNPSNPSPPINYASSCVGCFTNIVCGDNYITGGLFYRPTGYYDIIRQFDAGNPLDRTVKTTIQALFNPLGNACSPMFYFDFVVDVFSEVVFPDQRELSPSDPTTGISILKGESWTIVPQNQASARLIGAVVAMPTSINPYDEIPKIITHSQLRGAGWSNSFSTGSSNVGGLQLGFYKNTTDQLSITLNNLPSSNPPRDVLSEIIVDVTSNSKDVRLSPLWMNTSNTSQSTVILPYVAGNYFGSDVNILSLVHIGDFYRRVDTYLQNANLLHLYRANGIQYTIPNYTLSTLFGFISLMWAGGNGINEVSRKIKFISGENQNSPVADVSVILIVKKDKAEVIEDTASGNTCGGSACCINTDAQGRCKYEVEYNKVLWEIIARGGVTEFLLPRLPEGVDLPIQTPENYPDGNFPEVYTGQTAWCPGSVLCDANTGTYDFPLDSDPDPNIIADNATHLTWNSFGIGQPMVITPVNGASFPNNSNVTINGFVSGGGWDIVPCDSVRIYARDENGNTVKDEVVNLVTAGGCGAGLPPFCFSNNFICPSGVSVSIEIIPLSNGNQCGNTTEWSLKCGL